MWYSPCSALGRRYLVYVLRSNLCSDSGHFVDCWIILNNVIMPRAWGLVIYRPGGLDPAAHTPGSWHSYLTSSLMEFLPVGCDGFQRVAWTCSLSIGMETIMSSCAIGYWPIFCLLGMRWRLWVQRVSWDLESWGNFPSASRQRTTYGWAWWQSLDYCWEIVGKAECWPSMPWLWRCPIVQSVNII